ncbi:MAG: glycosyltransferase family 9 protein [Gammaproteobacteria bacterium]|nr:glycosyltransferase family 9 protein [Gammaproteobacteria bacterium]MDH3370071.1 glycosyltransferase family 9 protein [Gammaproteobacteria bacterium]MDH3562144.1 glycosyltransferase family 9 protein [Gammaproteobacteria bacterium]
MTTRAPSRILVAWLVLWQTLKFFRRRLQDPDPKRVLIAHHLYLGDTLTITPLLAKLREKYPSAEIVMTVPKAIAPLYGKRPYGITPVPYDPSDFGTLLSLVKMSGFDLAFVPGDNRFSWLARALGAKWIVAFAGDRPPYKSWPVDQFVSFPDKPQTWADMIAALLSGGPPRPYHRSSWPDPDCEPFDYPASPYCVLHVGASTPLKYWFAERWRILAEHLTQAGFTVVWSGGRKEQHLVSEIDRDSKYSNYAGALSLDQLWHLLNKASLLVTLDTGVAHLGRIVDIPTVVLFGPGSAVLSGAGEFWRDSRFLPVTIPDFPCRDQDLLFKRRIPWMKRCVRNIHECHNNLCMAAISVDMVKGAIDQLLIRSIRT